VKTARSKKLARSLGKKNSKDARLLGLIDAAALDQEEEKETEKRKEERKKTRKKKLYLFLCGDWRRCCLPPAAV